MYDSPIDSAVMAFIAGLLMSLLLGLLLGYTVADSDIKKQCDRFGATYFGDIRYECHKAEKQDD